MKDEAQEATHTRNTNEIERILKIVDEDPSIEDPEEQYSEFRFRIVKYSNGRSTCGTRFKVSTIHAGAIPGNSGEHGYRAYPSIGDREEYFFFQAQDVFSIEIKKTYEYNFDQERRLNDKPKERMLTFYINH